MICRLQEIEISNERPFQNCKLGREKYGKILTQVVSTYSCGCVMAINGEWGSGKTTFVKMWYQHLINEGFKTLYFNVWEHDFISDPIVGLVAQFRNMDVQERLQGKLESVISVAGNIFAGMAPAIAKGLAKKGLGEDIVDVIEAGIQRGSDLFVKELEEFQKQSKSMIEFRNKLMDFVNEYTEGKPLVFIVDELDRCNPHYAVKVLERIKHLFCIPNIVFVLSIDKMQLANSVRGYYGSDSINAEEYLKRFIDVEYVLPSPNIEQFCQYLFEVYEFDSFFNNPLRLNNFRNRDEADDFKKMSVLLFEELQFSLRQMEKLYAHMRLVLQTFRSNEYLHPALVLLLFYIRMIDFDFYRSLTKKSAQIPQIISFVEEKLPHTLLVPKDQYDRKVRFVIAEVARLLSCYSMDENGYKVYDLLSKEDNSKLQFIPEHMDLQMFQELVVYFERQGQIMGNGIFDLTYLINHIELLLPIQKN